LYKQPNTDCIQSLSFIDDITATAGFHRSNSMATTQPEKGAANHSPFTRSLSNPHQLQPGSTEPQNAVKFNKPAAVQPFNGSKTLGRKFSTVSQPPLDLFNNEGEKKTTVLYILVIIISCFFLFLTEMEHRQPSPLFVPNSLKEVSKLCFEHVGKFFFQKLEK
jgi:hypothetical protein